MKEFDGFTHFHMFFDRVEAINAKAAKKGARMIQTEVKKLSKLFPGHEIIYHSGGKSFHGEGKAIRFTDDSPHITVEPPLYGQSRITAYDCTSYCGATLRDFANDSKVKKLRESIVRMHEISFYVELTFERNLGYVALDHGTYIGVKP